ncbi:hypothetical protein ACQKWADRAFT_265770 [Trichoderma austrokoningii]
MANNATTASLASTASDFSSLDDRGYSSEEPHFPSAAPEAAVRDHGDNNGSDKNAVSISNEITAAAEKETIGFATICKRIKVTWDKSNENKKLRDITCQLNLNTSKNTALFRLQSHAVFKSARGNKSRHLVYIYIYPENLKTMTILKNGLSSSKDSPETALEKRLKNTYVDLQISMIQAPDLVRPRNHVFKLKNQTREELDLFCDLANATEVVLHFDSFIEDIPRNDIRLLLDAFSEKNKDRPRKDDRRANLDILYGGKGGEIATECKIAALPADVPPTYIDSTPTGGQSSKKRKRTETADALEEGQTDADDEEKYQRISTVDESFGARLLSILEDTNRCVHKMDTRMSEMEKRISKVEKHLASIDTRIFTLEMTGDKLETHFEDADERFNDLETQLRTIDYNLHLTKDRVDDVKPRIDRNTR